MLIRVVIPAHGLHAQLSNVVAAVRRESFPLGCEVDVVVVENGTEECKEAAARAGARYIHLRWANASNARNHGACSGLWADFVIFLDDDVIPRPGWAHAILEQLIEGRHAAVVGSIVVNAGSPPNELIAARFVDTAASMDPQRPFVAGGNVALAASAFRHCGGFNTDLGPGSPRGGGEDLLLGLQLVALGYSITFAADAVVDHHVPLARMTRRALSARARAAGRSDAWIAWHWHGIPGHLAAAKIARSALMAAACQGATLGTFLASRERLSFDIELLRCRVKTRHGRGSLRTLR
jgi:glycosyltransferase involved in cell wall biosynthesis